MTDAAPIGHNMPPGDTTFDRADKLISNANKWSAERPAIVDAEQAGAAQIYIDQLRGEVEELERQQKRDREPHDLAIVVIRAKYRKPLELLGIALQRMKKLADVWLAKEKIRLAAEESERRRLAGAAREAAERAKREAESTGTVESELAARDAEKAATVADKAASKAPARAQIKSDLSSRAMSFQTRWSAEVDDEVAALQWGAKQPACRADMLAAVVRHGSALARTEKDESKSPAGLRFIKRETAV